MKKKPSSLGMQGCSLEPVVRFVVDKSCVPCPRSGLTLCLQNDPPCLFQCLKKSTLEIVNISELGRRSYIRKVSLNVSFMM